MATKPGLRLADAVRRPGPGAMNLDRLDASAKPAAATVVVVDDHKIIRETLRLLLSQTGVTVVAVADCATAALGCVQTYRPDIVVLDVRLPDQNGVRTASRIHEQSPSTKVLMLSGYTTARCIKEALVARAYGFVTKQEGADECVRAVNNILGGAIHLSPEAVRILAQSRDCHPPP